MSKPKPFARPSDDDGDPPGLSGDTEASRQRAGRKPHQPSETDRSTVSALVAAGVAIEDIARVRGMSKNTLRKHYQHELENGHTVLNTVVILEWIKKIKAGDFAAIKWWTQSRMGFSEKLTIEDPAATNAMKVVVELVGNPAPQQTAGRVIEAEAPRTGSRVPGAVVQLRGST